MRYGYINSTYTKFHLVGPIQVFVHPNGVGVFTIDEPSKYVVKRLDSTSGQPKKKMGKAFCLVKERETKDHDKERETRDQGELEKEWIGKWPASVQLVEWGNLVEMSDDWELFNELNSYICIVNGLKLGQIELQKVDSE